jgi:putative spermidine/putrescine transport system permease protein
MHLSAFMRRVLAGLTGLIVVFLYAPLLYVLLLSFNRDRSIIFGGFTAKWWGKTFGNEDVQDALVGSIKTALLATLLALILGTLASLAVHRFEFFGREAFSFALILPIALPGIVSGLALNVAFKEILGWNLGFLTVVVAHTTFCIVVVFNNVLARLRRLPGNLDEASADLGASAWQTFRFITFPMIRTALVAGGLLSFALSFDEIVVTTFTAGSSVKTLPQFIYSNYNLPTELPIVNVVAVAVVLISVIPAWYAQRLADPDR